MKLLLGFESTPPTPLLIGYPSIVGRSQVTGLKLVNVTRHLNEIVILCYEFFYLIV